MAFEEELLREEIELMQAEIEELERSITKQVRPLPRALGDEQTTLYCNALLITTE